MADLPPIKYAELAQALLPSAETLVPTWLPGGVQRGHEYQCGDLAGGPGRSCSVNLNTGKWADFQTGEAGNDLLSLYASINRLSMAKAALELARAHGLESIAGVVTTPSDSGAIARPSPAMPAARNKPLVEEGWTTVKPVPDHAPQPTFWHKYRALEDIQHTAKYVIDGSLYGYVIRFRTSDGGKDPLPYTWCMSARDNSCCWKWKTWDEPRPLYFPKGVSPIQLATPDGGLPTVIVVEGEKKASVLQDLLDSRAPDVYLVVSWPGGCKAWAKADWNWLNGCTAVMWPDCDGKREPLTAAERKACIDPDARQIAAAMKPILPAEKQPGTAAMLAIGAMLRDKHACTVQVLPIPEPLSVPDGWDCADAICTDGWDFDKVVAFFGKAQPLQAAPHVDGAGGKKNDGPVSTGGVVNDHSGHTQISGRSIPDWLACYYDEKNKRWLTSRKMVILILERDELLVDVLSYNELSNNIQARVAWPWPHARVGNVTSAVDLLLGKYLTDRYGLPSIARAALQEGIQTVAHTRRFHPIREYLGNLKWDGTSRIDKWLIHVLGEKPETLKAPLREYLQIVGRCWLLGMVNRVMTPGCKFDYCPVLEGAGGLRKSTMVEILAGSDFYSDTPFEVGRGKEAQEQVQGLWLYEIAEMTHFSKSEVGAIKAFISSKVDRYREAYGATLSTFERQCVLVGTTNENTYLRDRTGNRRFWPIPVGKRINTEWLQKYRDQLFAEAYSLFNEGVPYTPTPEQEIRLFVPMQESRLVETAVQGELLHVLTRAPVATGIGAVVNDLTSFVTIAQLALALGVDAAKSSAVLESQIRGWLDHEGWQRAKKQINGARAWGYCRPANWPPQETDTDTDSQDGVNDPSTQEGDDEPF